jgi:hypothetical protein
VAMAAKGPPEGRSKDSSSQADFHARAWKLANDKARELVGRLAKP